MEFLERKRVVHCQLSASAVRVGHDLSVVKLSRLGKCRSTARQEYYLRPAAQCDKNSNEVRWLPPELLQGNATFGHASDSWAFGVLVWEVFSGGRRPYGGMRPDAVAKAVCSGEASSRIGQHTWSDGCPSTVHSLVRRCWETAPRARPAFAEIHAEFRIELLPLIERKALTRAKAAASAVAQLWDIPAMMSHTAAVMSATTTPLCMAGDAAVEDDNKTHPSEISELRVLAREWSIPRESVTTIVDLGSGNFGDVVLVSLRPSEISAPQSRRSVAVAAASSITGSQAIFAAGKTLTVLDDNLPLDPSKKYNYFDLSMETTSLEHRSASTDVDAALQQTVLWREFFNEVNAMIKLDHPNLVRILGVCVDSAGPPMMLLEYLSGGALKEWLLRNGTDTTIEQLEYMLYQVACGMHELCDHLGLIHRDLASRNVLVGENMSVKVADFGLARATSNEKDYYRTKGTDLNLPLRWLAPEVLSNGFSFTASSDAYAFGVVIFETLTLGEGPFDALEDSDVVNLLARGSNMTEESLAPALPLPPELGPPSAARKALQSVHFGCLRRDPAARTTFSEAVAALVPGKALDSDALVASEIVKHEAVRDGSDKAPEGAAPGDALRLGSTSSDKTGTTTVAPQTEAATMAPALSVPQKNVEVSETTSHV